MSMTKETAGLVSGDGQTFDSRQQPAVVSLYSISRRSPATSHQLFHKITDLINNTRALTA